MPADTCDGAGTCESNHASQGAPCDAGGGPDTAVCENGVCVPPCVTGSDCCDGACDGCKAYYCERPGGEACTGEQDCICTVEDRVFGDAGGAFGDCQSDGFANVHDAFHAFACLASSNPCDPENSDVGGAFGACPKDGFCNVHDAFHSFAALSSANPCSTCPADGGGPPMPENNAVVVVDTVSLSVVPRRGSGSAAPWDVVQVDVYLDSALADLQGYQLQVAHSGGRRGRLELIDVSIRDDRGDYVFHGVADNMFAAGVGNRVAFSGLSSLVGVATQARGYLATFTYRVSADAAGTFVVDVKDWVSKQDNLEQTFFIATGNGKIEVASTTPAVIVVTPGPAQSIR